MRDMSAYFSDDADVMNSLRVYKERREAVSDARAQLEEDFMRRCYVRKNFGHSNSVVGFEGRDDDADDYLKRVGLRWDKSDKMMKPDLRLRAGKLLQERLETLDSPPVDLMGMPNWHFSGPSISAPAIFEFENGVYVLWTYEPFNEASNTANYEGRERWTKIPLSEYYAAQERMKEKEASDADD